MMSDAYAVLWITCKFHAIYLICIYLGECKMVFYVLVTLSFAEEVHKLLFFLYIIRSTFDKESIMGTIGYIISSILIMIILLNVIAELTSKKRRSRYAEDYRTIMKELDDKLLEAMEERGINFTEVKRFVNDNGEGIVVVRDLKKKYFGIATKDELIIDKDSAIEEIRSIYEKKGLRVHRAEVEITVSENRYNFIIAESPFFPRGLLGSIIRDCHKELLSYLEVIEEDKKK